MTCPTCDTPLFEAAAYCHRCGRPPRGSATGYAVAPGESLRQFALVSTLMPHSNRDVADNYRWALVIGGLLTVALTLAGVLPAAVVAGAALVPLVYLVYIYDVNVWEDAPLPVVLTLFGITGVLAAAGSYVFFEVFEAQQLALFVTRGGITADVLVGLVVFAIVLPLVAEIVKQAGAVFLASRPVFDDLIDGMTFGIAAGTAYAAAETLVAYSAVFTSGDLRVTEGLFGWLVVVVNLMIVKSVIYGTASGIAAATFSGLGEGHDGFTRRYAGRFLLAVGANIAYWLGVRLLALLPFGPALGLLWGLLVAGVLLLAVRGLLQAALLESALEDAAEDRRPKGATTGGGWCPSCEMPLMPDGVFCSACGASLRATSAMARHELREPVPTE